MESKKFYLFFKYLIDKILALTALIVLSWLLILIAFGIALDGRGCIIFRQPREGKNRKIIYIYKFRTMKSRYVEFDKYNPIIDTKNGDATKIGLFLRRFKLDELPQLFNVLKGDMSFIGPRPLLPIYSNGYEKWEFRKFDARPGMSGLAQVSGNSHLSIHGRSYYDIRYAEKISFFLDVRLFFKTIYGIFIGEKKLLKEPLPEQLEEMRRKYGDE